MKREPWHYDAFEGRPDWSKELGRQRVIRRQQENMRRRRVGAAAQSPEAAKHDND